jgi:hypothetical protein
MEIKDLVVLKFDDVKEIFKTATPKGLQDIRTQLNSLYTDLKDYYGESFSYFKSLDSCLFLYEIDNDNDEYLKNVTESFMAFLKFYIQRVHETDPELP